MPTIDGTAGNDTLVGTSPDFLGNGGSDVINGLDGDDVIDGRGGADTLNGGAGNDVYLFTVFGAGRFAVSNSGGEDTLDFSRATGSIFADQQNIRGSPFDQMNFSAAFSNDVIGTALGIQKIIGGSGNDWFLFDYGPVEVFGNAGNDRIRASIAHGGEGNDTINARIGYGDAGDDIFLGGNQIFGGEGLDSYVASNGETIDLNRGTVTNIAGQTTGTLSSVEGVLHSSGSASNVTVIGSDGANRIDVYDQLPGRGPITAYGYGGADTIFSGSGNDFIDGGTGNDTLSAGSGNNIIIGGDGIDTVSIPFQFEEASFAFTNGYAQISGIMRTSTIDRYGTGATVNRVSGVEVFVFPQASSSNPFIIDRNDGGPLVDDLFYLASQRDVATARVDADAHYASSGWREGRDPNAYFDTTAYLGANKDVAAANLNPLSHYIASGAAEGRDPSVLFDSEQYLARNPDVAAAGFNPLAHYLQSGQAEGRPIYAAVGSSFDVFGFDAEYYQLAYEDVARGPIDPAAHYHAIGWKEGRDPNAYFDTSYYLARNPDVAAAGIDPLKHYHDFGWREGRDPSAMFDTGAYLIANPDVAAAGFDPLLHYLGVGRLEGRQIWDADPMI